MGRDIVRRGIEAYTNMAFFGNRLVEPVHIVHQQDYNPELQEKKAKFRYFGIFLKIFVDR